mgnify:CR=1 FL=1
MTENTYARVKTYMEKYEMIKAHDLVAAGVSGGADSVCLLHILRRLQQNPVRQHDHIIAALQHPLHTLRLDLSENPQRKIQRRISGDNYSFYEAENGRMVAVLSDGMGSGEKACDDSERIIEKMERLLEAGFRKETAVQMINGALVAAGQEEHMSKIIFIVRLISRCPSSRSSSKKFRSRIPDSRSSFEICCSPAWRRRSRRRSTYRGTIIPSMRRRTAGWWLFCSFDITAGGARFHELTGPCVHIDVA